MKVGIVLSSPPAYSETFFNSKIQGLLANGIEVELYVAKQNMPYHRCKVHKAPRLSKFKFVSVIRLAFILLWRMSSFKNASKFLALEKAHGVSFVNRWKKVLLNSHVLRADVDWLHFGFAALAVKNEFLAEAIDAKMAISLRGFDVNVFPLKYKNVYDLVFKQVDKVHSNSKYLYRKLVAKGLSSKVPHQIIVPATHFNPEAAQEYKVRESLVFVTVARLTWIKGLEVSIEAMRLLKTAGLNFQYRIIGGGSQKDIERYAYQVHEAGLTDCITFTGVLPHDKVVDEINNATLYIQPSLNEGFCNAVLESQALGKLSIASDSGGIPENLDDGVTGWLFETGNPNALVEKIHKVLALSENVKREVSKAAKDRAQNYFTIQKQREAFVRFYTEF